MKPTKILSEKSSSTASIELDFLTFQELLKPVPTEDYIELSGSLEEDMELESACYKVTDDDLIIPNGVTLTVHPGTIIEFAEKRKLLVHGHLNILEKDSSPVFLRSYKGQSWEGIEVYSEFWEAPASAILHHTVIEKAEAAINVGPRASVLVQDDCRIKNNKRVSQYVLGHLVIRDSEIFKNEKGWTIRSIGNNKYDFDRVGRLELANNLIRETHDLFEAREFGQVILQNNPYVELYAPLPSKKGFFFEEGNRFISKKLELFL